jgi:hypothetical protein
MHVQGRVSMCVCWLPPMTPDLRQRSINTRTSSQKLAAGDNAGGEGGYIYTSTDSGATWTEQTNAGTNDWDSIASSSDGAVRSTGADDTTHTHTRSRVVDECMYKGGSACVSAGCHR